ncbi:MAG: efflux RND transporter periplasmic adaptor subunit [Ardenticatenales bacterium]
MNRTTKIITGLVVVGAIGAGGWWWTHRTSTTTAARIELVRVRRGPLEAVADASGALAPDDDQSLSFPISGRVALVSATLGQAVAMNEPLVALDTADLLVQESTARSNLSTAQSSLASARTKLATLTAGADPLDLEVAKLNLDKARDARWSSQSQRDATCGRFKAGRAQETDCNQAQASVLQSEISVQIAELQYNNLLAGSDASTLVDARDAVTKAEAQRAIAQSTLDQASLRVSQATLTSPITGTVTALVAAVGAQAGVGQAMVTVSDLSRFRVEVALDETDVSRMQVGQKVRATVGAVPDAALTGEVVSIAPSAVPQSGVVLYPVVIRFDAADTDLRAGMTADVQIITDSRPDAIVLPLRALQSEGDQHFVDVLDQVNGVAATTAMAGGGNRGGGAGGARFGAAGTAGPGTPAAGAGALGGAARGTGAGRTGGGFGNGTRTGGFGNGTRTAGGAAGVGASGTAAGTALTEADITTRRVEVTLGMETDSQVEILTGVSPGDTVVIRSAAPSAAATTSSRPGGFGGGPVFGGPGR